MSANGSSAIPLDIIDAKSPANQYLVQLLEDKGAVSFQPMTEERIRLVFQVLDKVSPQLGTFSRLMGLLGAELHDAVYIHPGSQLWKGWKGTHAAPYFSLMQQMQDERNEEVDRLQSEIQRKNTILSQKEEETVTLRDKMSAVQKKNQTLQSAMAALKLEAEESRRKAEKLDLGIQALNRQLDMERQTHRQSLSDLQRQLDFCRDHIQEMKDYTASYQALQQAFQSPMTRVKQNILSAPGKVPADRTAVSSTFVSSYLQTSRHMYQQLLHVRNTVMDDFDAFLERQSSKSGNRGSQPQLHEETQSFLTTLEELTQELSLLSQQRESLEERHAGYNQVLSTTQSLNSGHHMLSNTATQSLKEADEKNVGRFLSAVLYPDETLLNRYAAMIYTSSDNGRIFEELPGADMCHSCAEKTLLCPHKFRESRLIRLPQNCTHIKICRPQVHLSAVQAKIEASKSMSLVGTIHGNHTAKIAQRSLDSTRSQSGATSWAMDTSFPELEKEFERINLKTESCRMISLELCVSVTQQLVATIVLQLEGKSKISQIQDSVWEFFRKRYIQEEISRRGLEDYLCALRRYAPDSQVLHLLGSILTHDLDPSILCYVLLHIESLLVSPLSDLGHFQFFLQKHYQFLEETERDSLLLEFTVYSEKCVSPSRVMSFILHLILQHREPLIIECQDELSTHLKTQTGHLTVEELAGALDEMCLRTDKTQMESFIQRSLTLTGRNLITLHSSAQIAAYQLERIRRWNKNLEVSQPDSDPGKTGMTDKFSDLHILCNILHLTKIN
ncbi:uncharacterized protein [Aquarana catesbeiana]|uniref:uncharacterized protein n=1 Tax=Aquarana catesbeiana TaxID=8400 RepID=UPI003CC9AAE3